MRKFLWLGAGFSIACVLGAYVLGSWTLPLGILLLVAGGILLLRKHRLGFGALGLALGLAWFGLFTHVSLAPAQEADGKTLLVTATAVDYSYETGYGTAVDAKLALSGRSFRCRLYLTDTAALAPGDRVAGKFSLRYTGPEGQRASVYHSGTGLFLMAYQKGDLQITPGDTDSFLHFPARLRHDLLASVEHLFPADTAAFAKALLLGDTTDMDYETDTALASSGIVHVVSVSGLHVSILFSVLYLLVGRRRYITPILGAALLVLVAAVTGFSDSIVRSCLMNGLMLLGLILNKEYDPLTALTFAVTVMLAINPLAVTSVGLQLSAASVLGIILFAQNITDWVSVRNFWAEAEPKTLLHSLRQWVSSSVGITLGATLTTAPLTALHFGTVSLVGWLTNLLTLWLVNVLFVGIIITVILGGLGGQLLAWVLAWGIRAVIAAAKLLGALPLAVLYTESPYISLWLVFAYWMLAVFLLIKRRHRMQLFVCTAVTLAAAVVLSWLEPRLDDYRLTAVDVGQGQCLLLQSDGRTYMVDCGGSHDETAADQAVEALHSQGVFRLDGLILTHYDRDHVGGVPYLLSRMPVDRLYLPVAPGMEDWTHLFSGQPIEYVEQDAVISWQDTQISLFAFSYGETTNESSLCILFQRENCDILITGDQSSLGETLLISENDIDRLDVLVVGHHGSKHSTGEFLLERTQPALAVISVGEDNSYNHPAQAVLERLKRFGCSVFRTDQQGTIIIKG